MNTEQIMIQVVVDMANEMKMLQIENGKYNLNPKDFTLNRRLYHLKVGFDLNMTAKTS